MATNPTYELFFHDNTGPKRVYRTRLFDRDAQPSATLTLNHGGDPIRLKMEASDNRFEMIRGMVATIGVNSEPVSGFTMKDLYTEDDRKWQVLIDEIDDANTVIRNCFTGYLSPFGAKEAYRNGIKSIVLTATCGLGTLKDYPFCVPDTTRPAVAHFSLYYILRTCLYWLGYELPIHLSLGIIEKSMASFILFGGYLRPKWPYSVLENIGLDTHLFLTDTGMGSCYTVLSSLLKTMEATIVQYPGYWRIVRLDELAQYIADDGQAPILIYPDPANFQFYGRTENIIRTMNRIATGIPLAGGELSMAPSEKKLTVKYAYGTRQNEIKNGDFSQGLQYWTDPVPGFPTSPPGVAVATGDGSEESPFGIKIIGTSSDFVQRTDRSYAVLAQAFGTRDSNTNEELTLSLTFVNIKNGGAKIAVHASVEGKGEYRLQEDGTWAPFIPSKEKISFYIFKRNVYKDVDGNDKPKPTEGEQIEITMNVVPGKGAYTLYIFLYRGLNLPAFDNDPTAYTLFRNVRLTKKDLAILDVDGELIKAEAPGVDRKRSADELPIEMGDQSSAVTKRQIAIPNPHGGITYEERIAYYLRYGALLRHDGTTYTPTQEWLRWGANPNDATAWKKIQQHLAIGRLEMTGRPAQVFTGELMQRDPNGDEIGPLDVIHAEELDTPTEKCYLVPLRGWEWDLQRNVVSVDAVEILHVPGVKLKNYWDGPGGPVLMDDQNDPPRVKTLNQIALEHLTPGKLTEILNRRPKGFVGTGAGFVFDPSIGIPISTSPAHGLTIQGILAAGKIDLFKKVN